MDFNKEAGDEKRDEIRGKVVEALRERLGDSSLSPDSAAEAADELLTSCVSVTPPEKEDVRLHLITMADLGKNAQSTKPGNVRLNLRQAVVAAASGTLTVAGVWSTPWLAPFAAIVVWNELHARATIELTGDEGCVIWSMWLNADGNRTVADAGLLEVVNAEREKAAIPPIAEERLSEVLNNLQRLRCIKRSRRDPSRWWLREWVSVNY